jgi:hypothetical protein
MLFILEDDVTDTPHYIEIDVHTLSSMTVEQLLFHFVKFRNIKNPGIHIEVVDLCMCLVSGSGRNQVETQLLPNSVIDLKKGSGSGDQKYKVYGLDRQLAAHREDVKQLKIFKGLMHSLSHDMDHFIAKHDSDAVGSKRYLFTCHAQCSSIRTIYVHACSSNVTFFCVLVACLFQMPTAST